MGFLSCFHALMLLGATRAEGVDCSTSRVMVVELADAVQGQESQARTSILWPADPPATEQTQGQSGVSKES